MTDEEISKLWLNHYPSANDFARAIIAARDEELRKQEPVGFGCFDPAGFLDQDLVGTEADCIFWRDSPDATNKWTVKALFTAPIPPDEPKLKRASLMAFGVISEIRKLVGNGKVQFVADLGGSIWTWPDAADSAITELRSVCFDAAPIQPTPSQQEALDSLAGLLLGIELPKGKALAARQERACCLRDFILARPDTEGSGK